MFKDEYFINQEDVQKIKNEIFETRQEILNILDKYYYYQNVIKPQILFDYNRHFGELENQIKEKTKYLNELERKKELINQKQKKGETITPFVLKVIDLIVKRENQRVIGINNNQNNFNFNFNNSSYNTYNRKIYKVNEDINEILKNKIRNKTYRNDWEDYIDSLQISQIYRKIVKKIHPDLHGITENFKKYWYNVQEAYRTKNHKQLKLYYLALCVHEDLVENSNEFNYFELNSILINLRNRLANEEENLSNLLNKKPFNLIENISNKLWIAKRKRFLREKLEILEKKIKLKENMLQIIIKSNLNKTKLHYSFNKQPSINVNHYN